MLNHEGKNENRVNLYFGIEHGTCSPSFTQAGNYFMLRTSAFSLVCLAAALIKPVEKLSINVFPSYSQ